ncbi:MAG TPA: multidrug efflux RND transporter permease subunit [Candidatus Binatia bacterium]
MSSRFFIDRPIFASVVSLLIVIAGAVAYTQLPVAQYPDITPPVIWVEAHYPGASAQVVADTVASPIEQEVNGVEGMLYMSSTSSSDGSYSLTITFEVGTDPDMASVLVQNRVNVALPRLPDEVRRQGITTRKQSTGLIAVVGLISPGNRYDDLFLANYATLNIRDELARINGVGGVETFPTKEYGMRLWLDPEALKARNLTTTEVLDAIREQNVQVAAGIIGQPPAPTGQDFEYTVTTLGRLVGEEQFEDIVVKTGEDGRLTRVKDVARVELGAKRYDSLSFQNGVPSSTIILYQSPGANAVEVARGVREALERISKTLPEGLELTMIYDVSDFVEASISEVQKTLLEAFVLVFLVVLVFLQSLRATIIPAITIPVSLIGTCALLLAFGFSINTLTLFGLVLAIGIVVDDAIVVVENVERNMREHGLGAREATLRAMREVFGPVVAITLVVMAVFLPTAALSGITGRLYRQFAVTLAVSTFLSAVNALTLSPALCAVFLRLHDAGSAKGVFGRFAQRFNDALERATELYLRVVAVLLRRRAVALGAFLALCAATWLLVRIVPTGFLPMDDQGYIVVDVQLPDGASQERTAAVVHRVDKILRSVDGISLVTLLPGFSPINGNASNNAFGFACFSHWSDRIGRGRDVFAIIDEVREKLAPIQEAQVLAFPPPAIDGLGQTAGFEMLVQDRLNAGPDALQQATDALVAAAAADPRLTNVFSGYRAGVPQLYADVDREKVKMLGIPLQQVFDTLQAYLGSAYVNDFTRFGRTFQVNVQADAAFRARPEDIERLEVRSPSGKMVPLGALLKVEERIGPARILRFNLFPSAMVTGEAAPGTSSGQALEIVDQLAQRTLPPGMSIAWTGTSYQELRAGGQGLVAFVLGLIVVYLILAAQYESWSMPLSVVLSVPLTVLSSLLALLVRGLDNNVFTQIGLVLLIALAARNAILIVEFAREFRRQGHSIEEAALAGARVRLRPILMTSFTFVLGVVPLVIASGAGASARRALGTAVFGGMLGGTLLGVLFIPLLYVVVEQATERIAAWRGAAATSAAAPRA